MRKTIAVRYPSEKQYRFAADLLTTRDWSSLSDKYRARLDDLSALVPEFLLKVDTCKWNDFDSAVPFGPVTFDQMRALIETVMPLPRKDGKPVDSRIHAKEFPAVFAGRYAIDTADGHLAFYKVSVPDEDSQQYYGRIFVDVMASEDTYPIRGAAARIVLTKIAVDPVAAAKRYGQEIGSCSKCGKTLTDEFSRAFGIGPVCRAKMGI